MFTITINHNDVGKTVYSIRTIEEADSENIEYLHWQKAETGDYALTDDDFVAKVIKKKKYFDKF